MLTWSWAQYIVILYICCPLYKLSENAYQTWRNTSDYCCFRCYRLRMTRCFGMMRVSAVVACHCWDTALHGIRRIVRVLCEGERGRCVWKQPPPLFLLRLKSPRNSNVKQTSNSVPFSLSMYDVPVARFNPPDRRIGSYPFTKHRYHDCQRMTLGISSCTISKQKISQ